MLMLYTFLLYALFASVFTVAKTGLEYASPFFLLGSRMLLAGVLLIGYQVLIKKEPMVFKRGIWKRVLMLAFFNIYLTNACEFWGLQYLSSFKTCFIYSLSPFVSALFCYYMFTDSMSLKKWAGLLVGFAGFLPILLTQTSTEDLSGGFLFFSWAELAVIVAAVSSVYGWILLKQLVKEDSLSFLTANGLSMLIGGALALAHSSMVEQWDPIPVTEFMPYLECTLLLIVISNMICYNLYGWLLKRYSPVFLSFAGFTTPLFSAFFGWLFLGEIVTWPFYVSFVIVLAGLVLFDQEELRQSYRGAFTSAPKPVES